MIIKGTERPKIETISKLIIKIPSLIAVFCLNLIIPRDNMFENFTSFHIIDNFDTLTLNSMHASNPTFSNIYATKSFW